MKVNGFFNFVFVIEIEILVLMEIIEVVDGMVIVLELSVEVINE